MELLGTKYGGWYLPKECELNSNSIIYSVGVGEDISFDIFLSDKYNCDIYLIDPTEKAKIHYNEAISFFSSGQKFTGNLQNDYYSMITEKKPNFDKFTYVDKGLWNSKTNLKFYKQVNPNYVSHSLIDNMFTNNYCIVETDTLLNIMNEFGHKKIDLLKMDIEGAEITVIENMLENNIFPKYLLVEFDLKLKKKDKDKSTEKIINKLLSIGYTIFKNDNWNITFILN